ncbi:septin 7 [Pancytospora epiphaga]|nr:septin 7 [Pancytospora epiphaga]
MKTVPTVNINYGKVNNDYVGLSTIPKQYSVHSIDQGFILNVMVVGRRGLGSSTLVNSIFGAPLVGKDRSDEMTTILNEIVEDGIRLKVSVTTYHGEEYDEIQNLISQRNKEYYESEQGLSLRHDDHRIHVCLYILPADRMSSAEISGMKKISKICNLIPIIAKADMYTESELRDRKEVVEKIVIENGITIFRYDLGMNTNVDDVPGVVDTQGEYQESQYVVSVDDQKQVTSSGVDTHVLATIASEKTYDFQGKIIRGRKYGWGFVDVTNEKHSDFLKLRKILITAHYEDLIWETNTVFYNAYRNAILCKEKNSNDSDAQELLKIRLGRLQAQMEDILEKKHRATIESLKKEESEIIEQSSVNETRIALTKSE